MIGYYPEFFDDVTSPLYAHSDEATLPGDPWESELEEADTRLDVDQTQYRYYPEVLRDAGLADADEGAQKWLKLAKGLDYSARLLVQFALRSAAQNTASQTAPWVELALQAGAGDGAEGVVVRFLLDDDDAASMAPGEASLKDRISRLESYAGLAHSVATELRARLSSEGGSD